MNKKNYRILSFDASFIYDNIIYEGKFEYKLDKEYYAKWFYNSFDFSLDKIYLEKLIEEKKYKVYTDDDENEYIDLIINVDFNSRFYKRKKNINIDDSKVKELGTKELRAYFYKNGFVFNNYLYKRYKRSCGSSRDGSCLFIRSDYYDEMTNWSNAGLTHINTKASIASWEAYRALSLSSIEDTIKIDLKNIIFIKDKEISFKDNVIVVESKKIDPDKEYEEVFASKKDNEEITNTIWDGEALLDESIFTEHENENYKRKSMMLLRNKFFKSCGFRTSIQKFFKDYEVKTIDDLNSECICFTSDITDIKMVVTSTSLKFIKYMDGGFTKENILKWFNNSGSLFGIVKHDKKTSFFNGRMVQTSYQLINTLQIDDEKAQKLLKSSLEYGKSVFRNKKDKMPLELIYHVEKANNRDLFDNDHIEKDILNRDDIIIRLIKKNTDFIKTNYFNTFRYDSVDSFKVELRNGNILIDGTNAVLFGNGGELLLSLTKKYKVENALTDYGKNIVLRKGCVYSKRFKDREIIVGARSPHITMGNILIRENDLECGFIKKYFPHLTPEIVCVNAIGENIQQMLNGCDYDSDSMLLTNDPVIKEAALKFKDTFRVPVCKIKPLEDDNVHDELELLVDLDYTSSHNQIGEIVNNSQTLNSKLWNEYNINNGMNEEIEKIYENICILAVLSGVEIDSAKRTFAINTEEVCGKINPGNKPIFFKDIVYNRIDAQFASKKASKDEEVANKARVDAQSKKRRFMESAMDYDTAMNHIFNIPNKAIDLRADRINDIDNISILKLFDFGKEQRNKSYEKKKDSIIDIIKKNKEIVNYYQEIARTAKINDNKGSERIMYENIRNAKKKAIYNILHYFIYNHKFNKQTLRYVIRSLESGNIRDKRKHSITNYAYDLLFNIPEVLDCLIDKKLTKELVEDPDGDIKLYNFTFKEADIKVHANDDMEEDK